MIVNRLNFFGVFASGRSRGRMHQIFLEEVSQICELVAINYRESWQSNAAPSSTCNRTTVYQKLSFLAQPHMQGPHERSPTTPPPSRERVLKCEFECAETSEHLLPTAIARHARHPPRRRARPQDLFLTLYPPELHRPAECLDEKEALFHVQCAAFLAHGTHTMTTR